MSIVYGKEIFAMLAPLSSHHQVHGWHSVTVGDLQSVSMLLLWLFLASGVGIKWIAGPAGVLVEGCSATPNTEG